MAVTYVKITQTAKVLSIDWGDYWGGADVPIGSIVSKLCGFARNKFLLVDQIGRDSVEVTTEGGTIWSFVTTAEGETDGCFVIDSFKDDAGNPLNIAAIGNLRASFEVSIEL